jgi:hypothetical protein
LAVLLVAVFWLSASEVVVLPPLLLPELLVLPLSAVLPKFDKATSPTATPPLDTDRPAPDPVEELFAVVLVVAVFWLLASDVDVLPPLLLSFVDAFVVVLAFVVLAVFWLSAKLVFVERFELSVLAVLPPLLLSFIEAFVVVLAFVVLAVFWLSASEVDVLPPFMLSLVDWSRVDPSVL